jgi:predicted nucleic acid-binding protein
MSGRPFFDTTILIYAVSSDDVRSEKAELILAGGGCISVQVLNEFAAVARRRLKMSWKELNDALAAFRVLCEPVLSLSVGTHEAALKIAARFAYNFYDAFTIAAALESGCDELLSEDLHAGQKIEGLTIRNPFATT